MAVELALKNHAVSADTSQMRQVWVGQTEKWATSTRREGDHMMKRSLSFIVIGMTMSLTLGAASAASAATTSGCTKSAPRASIDNTWAWQSPGSWGMPGQQLTYAIDVFNNDVGCGSSSFDITLSAPDGFSVSMPSSSITLKSASTGYVWADVTSLATAADGSYPLTASVARAGSSSAAVLSGTSYYKVYSSDTVPPKLYWENPSDGGTLSGRTAYVGFTSSDDHAVKKLNINIDGVSVGSVLCTNISSDCQASYKWSIRRVHGQHTATFKSTDWMGNVTTETVTFTVN
jgi:hypothetical protein